MPLTPFHWSVLVFGLLFFDSLYLPALAVSSVVMDLEPAYYIFLAPNADGALHGLWHTYVGVTIIGLAVAFLLTKSRKRVDGVMAFFKVGQPHLSSKSIYFSSLLAAYSHIFLDSFLYQDLQPFWPLSAANPFLGMVNSGVVYGITGLGLLLMTGLYIWRQANRGGKQKV